MVRAIARAIISQGVEFIIEQATGRDVPDIRDVIQFLQDELGSSPDDATTDEVEEALQRGLETGRLNRRQVAALEENLMVDFNTFMSIGLNKCGSDRRTFSRLVDLWNSEKEDIKRMTQAELREELRCP